MEQTLPIADLVGGTVFLLLTAAATRALSKRSGLPFTVMLVVMGIVVAQIAAHGPAFLHPLTEFEISAEVVLLIFLPTLIFESAFNLDSRQLRQNLLPVLFLAVPGVLLSTAVIGLILWWATPFDLPASLVLGALLSATDPVAVIALFKQLGAPKRLTVLVEGESLFNDATAIVLTRILLVVVAGGAAGAGGIADGIGEFLWVFIGGLVVGWLAALLIGVLLGWVENDPFIEVPLTIVLAYFSFLVAEEAFHVSGVMAVVAAGVVMGGWGRTKISPAVSQYLTELWEYFAFIANALIFLMVGIMIDLGALWQALPLFGWVVFAMLLSRLVVIYGLVPLSGKLPNAVPVSLPYRTVMYWGGLRGAIALALVLSLPELPYKDTFIALTAGAVLFTLLVQGLTIGPLVHYLKLDRAPLGDRLARTETAFSAVRHALDRIPELQAGGLFSARIAKTLEVDYHSKEHALEHEREHLRSTELDRRQERRLLYLRSFITEKHAYYDMFSKGHLSETNYRALALSVDLQIDAMRNTGELPRYTLHSLWGLRLERLLLRVSERYLSFSPLPAWLSSRYTARDYGKTWGQYQGSLQVLSRLDAIARNENVSPDLMTEVSGMYRRWCNNARKRLDDTAEQFPEFVNAMQARLGHRLLLHSEREIIERQLQQGTLPAAIGEHMLEALDSELWRLRGYVPQALHVEPTELLRKVSLFQDLTREQFEQMLSYFHPLTVPPNEYIIRQGEKGASMFFIVRGVVRILQQTNGQEREVATLMAGDFFGEKSLLEQEPRNATCRAVTVCALYELQRDGFEKIRQQYPRIYAAMEDIGRQRK